MDRKKLQEAARAKQKSKDRIENVKQFAKDMGVDIVDLAKPTEEDVFVLGAMAGGPVAGGGAFALTRLRRLLKKILKLKKQRKAQKASEEMKNVLSPEEQAMFDEMLEEMRPTPRKPTRTLADTNPLPKMSKEEEARRMADALEKVRKAEAAEKAAEAAEKGKPLISPEEEAFMREIFGGKE